MTSAYTAALRQLRPNGLAYTLYNQYERETPSVRATLDADLFGGLVRVQGGLYGSYVRIGDYDFGQQF